MLVWQTKRVDCWGCFIRETIFEFLFRLNFGIIIMIDSAKKEVLLFPEGFFPSCGVSKFLLFLIFSLFFVSVAAHFSELDGWKKFFFNTQNLLAHNLHWVSFFDDFLAVRILVLFVHFRPENKVFGKSVITLPQINWRGVYFAHFLVLRCIVHKIPFEKLPRAAYRRLFGVLSFYLNAFVVLKNGVFLFKKTVPKTCTRIVPEPSSLVYFLQWSLVLFWPFGWTKAAEPGFVFDWAFAWR